MKSLIIYAHPNTKGHCPKILEKVVAEHKKRKLSYEVLDLYRMKYDPVLHEEEHYTSGGYKVSKQNKDFQKKIMEADNLIFIYPVWWSTMPAILKGWIDRVLTSHFAFKYEGRFPKGLLKGKKAAVIMTSGAPALVVRTFLAGRPIKVMVKDTLGFCGVKGKAFHVDSATVLDDKQMKKIDKRVDEAMDWLYG